MLSTIFCFVFMAATAMLPPLMQPSCQFYKVQAFSIPTSQPPHLSLSSSLAIRHESWASNRLRLFSSIEDNPVISQDNSAAPDGEIPTPAVVRAPLKFVGPYPCLALKFPNLATESQRSRNLTGISLDFVLDTAANINTIQGQVAQELKLEILEDSPALPGVSSSGVMGGGDTYVLGDSELEQAAIVGMESESEKEESVDGAGGNSEPFAFMQNLTAAVFPVGNPASAGLLGLAFFYCFEGGVEFRWGAPNLQLDGTEPRLVDGMLVEPTPGDESSPSITFYGLDDATSESSELQRSLSELQRVPIELIPVTQLPSVQIRINGVEMVALLDTGSPVTVLNERAAEAAGIQTTKESLSIASQEKESKKNGWNPFAGVVDKFKETQAMAEAASRGEILMIAGADGKPTNLYRSTNQSLDIALVGSSGEDVSLASDSQDNNSNVYVGEIPGLAALNGIGVDSPPAVVLGLDVLRQRPRMVFRPREKELYI